MKKIGIMGGTFDPVHIGHLILAECVRDTAGLDEVRFLPSGISYLKKGREDGVSPAGDRLEMCRLAIEGNPYFSVSDLEIRRGGNSYTCETMEALRAAEPDNEFCFLCGADSVLQMASWYRPDRLFSACRILAVERGDKVSPEALQEAAAELKEQYGARISVLPMRDIPISSTELREALRSGRSVRYRIPEAVERYIRARGLYHG
ncbi:nicotinate-nucleotide adenylyltransferase [Lachnoclostridium sp. Marseille-P6806]|uniref:nicotinate-nucleotide adenylyltransferase n=1 Tax=Lachnoclostridium sp. Marseille-P6806 TaxID=2364793 RepID=UPI00103263F0|nr:nicotinate-nucleotide adenylyltransferase [Lachnoclostridium sp. Marseille-P6806]